MSAMTMHPPLDRRIGTIGAAAIAGMLVLLIDPVGLVALSVALVLVWCGWREPAIGVGIVAATIPVQERLVVALVPAELTVTQLTVLPLIGGWGASWLYGRIRVPLTPTIVVWGLVTAAMALSIVTAVDRGAWAKETYRWAIALALLAVATSAIRRFADAIPVLIGISIGIVVSASVGFLQVVTDTGPPSFSSGGLMRAYAWFGEPNPFAAYLEMSVLLLVPIAILLLTRKDEKPLFRVSLPVVVTVGVVALLLTQSRGGMLGFAAGGAVIAFWYARWSRIVLLAGVLIALPVVLLTSPGKDALDRFTSSVATVRIDEQTTTDNWSVHERIAHWRAGVAMFESEPLNGIGAGNFDARYREYTEIWRFRIPRGHAHNSPIQVAAQTGVIGLIPYLALFFVAGARIARGVSQSRCARSRALALGALGVLISVAVHGQFDYLHGLSLNLSFVIALAMAEPALRGLHSHLTQTGAMT